MCFRRVIQAGLLPLNKSFRPYDLVLESAYDRLRAELVVLKAHHKRLEVDSDSLSCYHWTMLAPRGEILVVYHDQ